MQPVTITEKALVEIKNILKNKNIPSGYGLRVGVKGGGCGVSFVLGFDKEKEGDLSYEVDGVPVYVQKRETMFLVGKEIDWYEGETEMGFVFNSGGS
ncbi:iron-sulfur cluster assembly accessory protein [Marinoscillum sp. MHG1-6]|uniref:HesB/IscA family protein n=1 Tax=Marinoscillum sp. MHG1-6 TaxID=2959627 RepID=UPI0021583E3B|nr:iron-sulfur cluster biosynthesis family protein [Marinoscillum sp. MHG1-6]